MSQKPSGISGKAIGVLIVIVIIVAVILGFVASSFYSVGVSEQAIVVNPYDGTITLGAKGPTALAQKNPLANVIIISTSTQTIQLDGANTITGLTKDNLNVTLDVVVTYNIRGDRVIPLYKQYPALGFGNSRIVPIIRAAVRDVVAVYPAETLQTVRAELQTNIESRINATLTADPSLVNAINIGQINLKHIGLPTAYLNAINFKLAAQQNATTATYQAQIRVIQAQASANATIQAALGNARAVLIQANATRQSQIIVTNGTATGIHQIAVSLHLNATQTAALVQQFVFMQQLQQLCALPNNPCSSMILFIGANGQSQIFQIPPATKP